MPEREPGSGDTGEGNNLAAKLQSELAAKNLTPDDFPDSQPDSESESEPDSDETETTPKSESPKEIKKDPTIARREVIWPDEDEEAHREFVHDKTIDPDKVDPRVFPDREQTKEEKTDEATARETKSEERDTTTENKEQENTEAKQEPNRDKQYKDDLEKAKKLADEREHAQAHDRSRVQPIPGYRERENKENKVGDTVNIGKGMEDRMNYEEGLRELEQQQKRQQDQIAFINQKKKEVLALFQDEEPHAGFAPGYQTEMMKEAYRKKYGEEPPTDATEFAKKFGEQLPNSKEKPAVDGTILNPDAFPTNPENESRAEGENSNPDTEPVVPPAPPEAEPPVPAEPPVVAEPSTGTEVAAHPNITKEEMLDGIAESLMVDKMKRSKGSIYTYRKKGTFSPGREEREQAEELYKNIYEGKKISFLDKLLLRKRYRNARKFKHFAREVRDYKTVERERLRIHDKDRAVKNRELFKDNQTLGGPDAGKRDPLEGVIPSERPKSKPAATPESSTEGGSKDGAPEPPIPTTVETPQNPKEQQGNPGVENREVQMIDGHKMHRGLFRSQIFEAIKQQLDGDNTSPEKVTAAYIRIFGQGKTFSERVQKIRMRRRIKKLARELRSESSKLAAVNQKK